MSFPCSAVLFIARSGKTAANEQQQPNLRNQLCFRMTFCSAPRSKLCYLQNSSISHTYADAPFPCVMPLCPRFCCNPASPPYPQSLSVTVRRSLMSKLSKTAPRAIREWRNSLRRPSSYPSSKHRYHSSHFRYGHKCPTRDPVLQTS